MAAKPVKHVGFGGAVSSVMRRQGVSKASAQRIIGKGKAEASAAARRRNPRLNRTGGRKARRTAKPAY